MPRLHGPPAADDHEWWALQVDAARRVVQAGDAAGDGGEEG